MCSINILLIPHLFVVHIKAYQHVSSNVHKCLPLKTLCRTPMFMKAFFKPRRRSFLTDYRNLPIYSLHENSIGINQVKTTWVPGRCARTGWISPLRICATSPLVYLFVNGLNDNNTSLNKFCSIGLTKLFIYVLWNCINMFI